MYCKTKAVEGKRNVPLFGDQMRNARMLVRHGGAIMLQKFDIADVEKLRTAIATVLENPSFNEKAQRLRQMLRNQPISPHELLLKHAEFAARFGRLPNLDPYGRELSLVQYYLIDIFAVIIGLAAGFLVILILLLKRFCCKRERKSKSE
ncbi:hypothetical protein NECAME_13392 [Necator americanus]|uniref:glucuronosyltransferase n=1 Tax=Necator americanus TaxID=51031 RepID=W2SY83_NECAM|nr:hypothetical protein NECAME_13392 [Necator americanus]ETN73821.1 hypothetical protein NECAME_13392 [Necator americanus]